MSLTWDSGVDSAVTFPLPARGDEIPVDGVSVTAFVGPTPRGPVDRAVAITSPADFEQYFSVPQHHCRMEIAVRQFFANGGTNAVAVRVSAVQTRNSIRLPGAGGDLLLAARNPGPFEFLRASVDYDGIADDSEYSFNLVIQRLRTAESAWIDAQECYRGVTVDPQSRDFIVRVLEQSTLVRCAGQLPDHRPAPTIRSGSIREAGYIAVTRGPDTAQVPDDYDLIGSPTAGTGLSALENIADLGQLCLLSGGTDGAIGPVALLAADRFCRRHNALLIVDPPAGWKSVSSVMADQRVTCFASPHALTWYPCVWQRNAAGERMLTTAVGAVAAALNVDHRSRRLTRLPDTELVMLRAGIQLDAELTRADILRLARAGVNTLVRRSAVHMQLQGKVTQARYAGPVRGSESLTVRRDLLFILRRLQLGTRWVTAYPSTPQLWRELHEQVSSFMTALQHAGLLTAMPGAAAFMVQCDATSNAGLEGRIGETCFVVSMALLRPDHLLVYRFRQSPAGCVLTALDSAAALARAG